jgi:26S proteasome regulatory subunit (ATPase 3-interacting protein)
MFISSPSTFPAGKFRASFSEHRGTSLFRMAPKPKSDAKSDVLQLLTNKNRPYSVISLGDELHGEYPKAAIQKALDSLTAEGKIICKLFGKTTKLYFPNQEGLPVARPDELIQMDAHLESLRDKATALKQRLDDLRRQRNALAATKPIPELIAYRDELAAKVEAEEQRKNELIALAEGITPEDAERFQKEFRSRCEQWRSRRNKCKEIIDTLCDAADKKPGQIIEELDLETDESQGVRLEFKDKQYFVIE